MFPLNIILDSGEEQGWQNEYYAYYNYDPAIIRQFTELFSKIIMPTQKYAMPVILLDKETPKEAVCQVFENVNTGGVSLTVFELVTAIFAMDDFQLRKDWDDRKEKYFSGELLNIVTATDFLTALTLLSSFESGGTVSCKKKDVLALQLSTYNRSQLSAPYLWTEIKFIPPPSRTWSSSGIGAAYLENCTDLQTKQDMQTT